MRKYIAIALIALIVIAGCISSGCISQEENKIKVGVMPDEATLPYYVAEKEGIFTNYGLDVEVVPFLSAMERDSALMAGEIDAGENDPVGVILLQNAGYDARVVGLELQETAEKMRFAIVASPSSNINSIEDLEGKKIAISSNTIIEYLTDTLLGDVHADKVEVKKVPIRMQMLLDNEVDAATLPEPLASYAIFKGAKLIISDDMLTRSVSQTVIVFSADFIKENPESVDKFLDAYGEAVERINSDPESYRALLVEKIRIPEEIAGSYKMATYLQPQPYPREKFEEVLNWMQNEDLVQRDISYEDIVYESA
ncbi:MAG: ABC transporter substrate-binding protein [Methanophagales archaeon]|nr:ABC transporter substrate-binding protein [Methanophagales archaeon]